jgi:hypothetical protein
MSPTDWTSLVDWVVAFRALHEDARKGRLDQREMARYEQERESLAKALLVANLLQVKPGQTARQTLRVVRVLPVELMLGARREKATTLDVGLGGFAVLLKRPPRVLERIEFALNLGDAGAPVRGEARVVSVQRKGGPYRVAFAFEELSTADVERLGFEIFDAVLVRIPPPP